MSKPMNIIGSIAIVGVVGTGIAFAIPASREAMLNGIAKNSTEYKKVVDENLVLSDELKLQEALLFSVQEKLTTLEAEKQTLTQQKTELEQQLQEKQQALETETENKEQALVEIETIQTQLNSVNEQLETKSAEIETLNQQVYELSQPKVLESPVVEYNEQYGSIQWAPVDGANAYAIYTESGVENPIAEDSVRYSSAGGYYYYTPNLNQQGGKNPITYYVYALGSEKYFKPSLASNVVEVVPTYALEKLETVYFYHPTKQVRILANISDFRNTTFTSLDSSYTYNQTSCYYDSNANTYRIGQYTFNEVTNTSCNVTVDGETVPCFRTIEELDAYVAENTKTPVDFNNISGFYEDEDATIEVQITSEGLFTIIYWSDETKNETAQLEYYEDKDLYSGHGNDHFYELIFNDDNTVTLSIDSGEITYTLTRPGM